MADIQDNGTWMGFFLNLIKQLQSGELPNYPNPPADTTTGPLTSDELADFRELRNLKNNLFALPPED